MEWQVGQWVECDGRLAKVHSVRSVMVHLSSHDGTMSWDRRKDDPLIKPFVWQVGKTYKTTLDGAFGKVLSIDDEGDIYGNVYTTSQVITSNYWHAKTGKDFNEQRGADLLPFFADEPSEQKSDTSNPAPSDPFPTFACDIGDLLFYRGGAMHFLVHCGKFGNDELTDLRNAKTYVEMEIARLEKQRKGGA